MTRKHLIAVDGSDEALKAFNWFLDNMYRSGDTVILVHVAEYNIDIGLPGRNVDVNAICAAVKKRNDEIGNLTDGFMNVLRGKHITSKLLTLQGDKPGEVITKAARDELADSVVMGTRGLGTIRRTLLGSVSEYVVHHAHCPVTIVRADQ
ncbi:universal stress protein in QAH/OAS sulfhydrylase 3'region-like [Physella acuta]|uniref:universal stress protein in QAH/OAS sulfhydrylase 3'region-like n=1 Tax=Physella acuta TaxID=109671 RepID=UPI0027DD4604|nr:universal stress protein in QAH/OAS sulfhydrylase 3'region-like [Physella acuta]